LAFQDTTSREYLISGAAGTGKTLANLLKLLWFGDTYPGARMLIVRKTRHSLTETALVTWERDVLGEGHPIIAKPIDRGHRHAYKFPNKSVLVTGGMDRPDKVLSSEWDLIFVPEATDLELGDWETLGGRLRAMAGPFDQLFGDCNPTSPEHWLKKRCDLGKCRLYESKHFENPRYYDYRAAKWTEAGERYVKGRLQQMTGHRRKRFLFGLWVAAEGVIYPFDATIHGLPASWKPNPSWKRVWSIDWGKTSPTVLQMWAVDPDGQRMHLYKEWFKTNTRPDRLGKWAKEQIETGAEPRPQVIVCDHDTANAGYLTGFEGASGLHLTLADKADRNKGIEDTQAMFDRDGPGLPPRIFFKANALVHEPDPYLEERGVPSSTVAELLAYTWDADFRKDVPIEDNDHGCFVAGTLVETESGPVAIELVKVGDHVLTRDGYREVEACGMTNEMAHVRKVRLSNGATLTGTPNHPVYVKGSGFRRLEDLRPGEELLTAPDAELIRVVGFTSVCVPTAVFNLTVAGQPEYFASGVLVHNCDAMRYAQRYVATNLIAKPMPQIVVKPLLPAWARNPIGPSGWNR